jgi:hypothetical protein
MTVLGGPICVRIKDISKSWFQISPFNTLPKSGENLNQSIVCYNELKFAKAGFHPAPYATSTKQVDKFRLGVKSGFRNLLVVFTVLQRAGPII